MSSILFLLGLVGFAIWLLRQPQNVQFASLGVLCGAMFLYSSFMSNLLNTSRPLVLTLVLFLSIFTSIGVNRLKQVR